MAINADVTIPTPGGGITIPTSLPGSITSAVSSAVGAVNPFGQAAQKVYSAVMTAGMELAISLVLTAGGIVLLVWAVMRAASATGISKAAGDAAATGTKIAAVAAA